jgi:hypothetical protein
MMTRIAWAFGLLLMAGCAAQVSQEVPANHPASPEAAEAAPIETSTVLALDSAEPIRPAGRAAPEGGGMQRTPMQQGGNHAGHGQASTQPAPGQQLYMCPMHPEVTSTNPNAPCPKCGMKINKPVKPGTTRPATQPGPPADDHSTHRQHGGH